MGVIGESVVSAMVGKVIDKGLEYLADQYDWQTGMKKLFKKLKHSVPRIQAVVRDADAGHLPIEDGPVRDWWWQLRDALYAADDVINDFEYLRLAEHVLSSSSSSSSSPADANPLLKVRKLFDDTVSSSKRKAVQIGMRAIKKDPVLQRLREVVHMFGDVCDSLDLFERLVSKEQQRQLQQHEEFMASRESSSVLTNDRFVGHYEEREKIVELLLTSADLGSSSSCADDSDAVSLVSIVGHGGMGKTTLSQHVFNDKRVNDHFDLKIWVCVSNCFDVRGLTRNMLEGATGTRPDVESLNVLQDQLKKKLTACKRFLVVLDDAWNDKSSSDWRKLFAPLNRGPAGSKILLTTRMETVAEMAEKGLTRGAIQHTRTWLNGLAEQDQLILFNEHAFSGLKNPYDYDILQSIGKKIAGKLGGSPLAAKVVGEMLNSNMNVEYWENVLHGDISKFEEGEKGILSALTLSYNNLPEHLRPCFAYCSIFPPDYRFNKDELVYMWMAMGFIQQSSQGSREMPEEIGSRYFEHLLKRSFFERGPHIGRYVIHDLLHEMAEYVSRDECIRFTSDTSSQKIPKTVRHLSLINTGIELLVEVDNIVKWANLRTLNLVYDTIDQKLIKLLKKIFEALEGVRILTVSAPTMVLLPDSIGTLKNLKYVQFAVSSDKLPIQFPNSLSKWYNLQTMNLTKSRCRNEFVLPQNMNNLIRLRHLMPVDITKGIAGVGKLTSLNELVFTVKTEGVDCKIRELKGLNVLRKLEIYGLENVKSEDETREAELHCKEHLKELRLEWSSREDSANNLVELDEKVLECLRPGSKISKLTIKGYMGSKSADWMELQSVVEKLEYLVLEDCPNWEQLLILNKLPCLKYLHLSCMSAVKSVDLEGCIQQLEKLHIRGLEKLEECYIYSESAGANGVKSVDLEGRPHLRRLEIDECPKLVHLAVEGLQHIRSVEEFRLTGCPQLQQLAVNTNSNAYSSSLRCLTIGGNGDVDRSLPIILLHGARSLSELFLVDSKNIASLPPADVMRTLTSLRYLYIRSCEELVSLEGLASLSYPIKDLYISGCSKLVEGAEAAADGEEEVDEKDLTLTVDRLGIDDPKLLRLEQLRSLNSVRVCIFYGDKWGSEKEMVDVVEPWLHQNRNTLQRLHFTNVTSLTSLPASLLKDLSSLENVDFIDCPNLQSLPEFPLCVKYLTISGCTDSLKERCKKDIGAYWPYIKHIPTVRISD